MRSSVRETVEIEAGGGVVVGDDGSACATAAVRAASAEARLRGVPLHVVRAWSLSTAERPEGLPMGVVPSMPECESATQEAEQARVDGLLGADAGQVHVHVVHAQPAKALVDAAQHADLLVVGTRGRGGFRQLLVGSVAEQCIRHATCSVLVVRDPADKVSR